MKRYSFKTKKQVDKLLSTLFIKDEGDNLIIVNVTKDINGIMIWGFEHKNVPILDADRQPTYDKDGDPLFNVIKGKTYNVDVVWKGTPPTVWKQYEVNPKTPSHVVS